MTNDSYLKFLNNFKINHYDFIKYGIDEVILVNEKIAEEEWNKLKKAILNGEEAIFIRKYGKQRSNPMYVNLYNEYFKNIHLKEDSGNNTEGYKRLPKFFGLNKYNKSKHQQKENTIDNYQFSHIFGKTKNPFCFLAPWNIALIPKIYDPFSGHESNGDITKDFQHLLAIKTYKKFKKLIDDYNNIIPLHADNLINIFERKNKFAPDYKSRLIHLKKEWASISFSNDYELKIKNIIDN